MNQKRVHANVGDEEDKRSTSVYAEGKVVMDRKEKHAPNTEARHPKKQKSDSPSHGRSIAIPSVLTSSFASVEGSRNMQHEGYDNYQEYQGYQQHESQQNVADHEYYLPRMASPQNLSMLQQQTPRRANTYPHFDNCARRGGEHNANIAKPRRIRSHRANETYAPYPSRESSQGPVSPYSAFEAYPPHNPHEQQQEFLAPRSGRIPSTSPLPPNPLVNEQEQYDRERDASPISYVCESARTCYPSTTLGKRVRDEVRSMTEGTRLVPTARAIRHDDNQSRGMIPDNDAGYREYDRHRSNSHKNQHPQSHPYPRRYREVNTIRLLDSTKDILENHSVLGRGSFSRVTAVTIKKPKRKERDDIPISQSHHHPRRRVRYYACKSIKEEILVSNVARMGKRNRDQSETYRQSVEFCVLAASQLAYEAHILNCLDHPNIVKMRGLDSDGILGFEKRDHRGFFLLIDVLSETLDQKINRWRRERSLMPTRNQRLSRNQEYYNDPSSSNQEAVLLRRHKEKIDICLQLSSALEYLHDRRVVYRDLKPSNVGFVADNWSPEIAMIPQPSATRVQLFDFGLSRELTSRNQTLRGAIGTMRYMAPEVCLDLPYNCDCDIYSYGILSWELWTQQVPFEDVATPDLYRKQVCKRGYRPVYRQEEDPLHRQYSLEEEQYHQNYPQHRPVQNVPNEILALLSQTWKHDPKSRIRWAKTRHQLTLIETLVSLQLEERELSQSTPGAVAAAKHSQAHNDFNTSFPGGALDRRGQRQGQTEIGTSHQQDPRYAHSRPHYSRVESKEREDPNRVEKNDSFSLRDEDFDADLGI